MIINITVFQICSFVTFFLVNVVCSSSENVWHQFRIHGKYHFKISFGRNTMKFPVFQEYAIERMDAYFKQKAAIESTEGDSWMQILHQNCSNYQVFIPKWHTFLLYFIFWHLFSQIAMWMWNHFQISSQSFVDSGGLTIWHCLLVTQWLGYSDILLLLIHPHLCALPSVGHTQYSLTLSLQYHCVM